MVRGRATAVSGSLGEDACEVIVALEVAYCSRAPAWKWIFLKVIALGATKRRRTGQ